MQEEPWTTFSIADDVLVVILPKPLFGAGNAGKNTFERRILKTFNWYINEDKDPLYIECIEHGKQIGILTTEGLLLCSQCFQDGMIKIQKEYTDKLVDLGIIKKVI